MLKPGSTRCRLSSVRTNNPAPTSSNNDSATCTTTKPRLSNEREAALELRPLSFSVGVRSTFVARHAGARPKTIPVNNESASVKPSTRQSSCGSSARIPRRPNRSPPAIRP